jgi:septal ring factor EnvC (AmiA/AmiB activator)
MRQPVPRGRAPFLLATAFAIAVAGSPAAPPQGPPRAAGSEQSGRAAERIRALRAEADALLKQERSVLAELRRREAERDARVAEVRSLESQSATVERELTATESHIAALERTHEEQAPVLRQRLVELYKLGAPGYTRLLAGVDDLRELGRAYRVVTALAQMDRERARAHASTLTSLRGARDELAARRQSLSALRRDQDRARQEAEAAVRSHAALVASIDARRDLNAQLTSELVAAQETLEQQLAATGSSDAVLPLAPFKGMLDWPVAGRVARRFVAPGVVAGGVERRGIDITAAPNAPVLAVHEGTVAYAAPFAGFGNLVILDHGGRAFSVYGYLDRIDVSKGSRVSRGQALGAAGTAPSGFDAVYFELRVDGRAVDPVQWLKLRP